MRKIKYACEHGAVHHQLAVLAITQAGMMRGFRSSDGIKHDVVLDEGATRGHAGTYSVQYLQSGEVFCLTTAATGCMTSWRFTWPDMKLTGYQLTSCECTGFHQIDYMRNA